MKKMEKFDNLFYWEYFVVGMYAMVIGIIASSSIIWLSGLLLVIPSFAYGFGYNRNLRDEICRIEGKKAAFKEFEELMRDAIKKEKKENVKLKKEIKKRKKC
jgi:hypothetical protein